MAIDGRGMKTSDTERILSKENLTETTNWLETALNEQNASQKEISTSRRLLPAEAGFLCGGGPSTRLSSGGHAARYGRHSQKRPRQHHLVAFGRSKAGAGG